MREDSIKLILLWAVLPSPEDTEPIFSLELYLFPGKGELAQGSLSLFNDSLSRQAFVAL